MNKFWKKRTKTFKEYVKFVLQKAKVLGHTETETKTETYFVITPYFSSQVRNCFILVQPECSQKRLMSSNLKPTPLTYIKEMFNKNS